MKKNNILILFFILFLFSSCTKNGNKTVEKLNDELKNSSIQFSLSPKEIKILKKSYHNFSDKEKEIFDKILQKYNSFKEKNEKIKLNFEKNIKRLKQEILNIKNNNDINFINESSKNIKLDIKFLQKDSTINLNDLNILNGKYIIELTEDGEFSYYEGDKLIIKKEISKDENPKFIRIIKTNNTKIKLKGNLLGKIAKDNIDYNSFNFLPMGIFKIGKDIKPGLYDIETKSKDTKIYIIKKEKEYILEREEKESLKDLKLFKDSYLLILDTNYIKINKK